MALQTLYVHQEQTIVGGIACYLLNLSSADATGTTIQSDAGNLTRLLMGHFVYRLTGVQLIPASTWTIYYRAQKTSSQITAHCDVDVLIRTSAGALRSIIATDAAASASLSTSWSTLSGTCSWADYTVVDQTDYMETDFFIHVTGNESNEYVQLRIDDNTLAIADQTRVTNIYLPNTYDHVLRVSNTVTDSWQIRLKTYSNSTISRLKEYIIYFHNFTDGTSNQIVIQNGTFTNQTGPWYDLGPLETIYIAMIVQANSTETSYVYAYLEVRTPGTTIYAQYIIKFEMT
jgi:hypothetical protein